MSVTVPPGYWTQSGKTIGINTGRRDLNPAAVGAPAVLLLPKNPNRTGAVIKNASGTVAYVGTSADMNVRTSFQLGAGDSMAISTIEAIYVIGNDRSDPPGPLYYYEEYIR